MMKWGVSGTWEVPVKSLFLWGISMDMWGNELRVLKVFTGGMVLGKEMQKEEDCWSFVMKELCVANTWFKKTDKRKITYSGGGCETEIDFVLVGEKYRKYIRDVKVIPWELQHRLVVVDLDKKVLKKGVKKERIIRRKIWKLNENRTRVRFEKRVKELVNADAPDLWKTFKDGVLKACDEVCGTKKSRRDQGDMWWWNEEVKDTIARKKAAFKELCRFPS